MSNQYYDHVNVPATGSPLSSATMRAEFSAIEQGFDKLPAMTGNANKLVKVNPSGTALETTDTPDINGGTIDDAAVNLDGGSLVLPQGTAAAPTTEGQVYWNTSTDTLTVGNGAAAEVLVTENNAQTLTNKTIDLTSNTLVATSAQLAAAVTDETGSGSLVFGTSPTLATPAITGGTINNTAIGGTTPSTGAFTTLSTSGNVGIGTSSPASKLHVSGDIQQENANYIKGKLAAGTTTRLFGLNASDSLYIGSIDANHTGGTLFVKNGAEQMRIDSSGNLGLGATASAWSGNTAIQLANSASSIKGALYQGGIGGNNVTGITHNAYYNGTSWQTIYTAATYYASRYEQTSGQHAWYTAPLTNGTITFTQAMTLDASGNLALGSTSTSGMRLSTEGYSPELYDPSTFSAKYLYLPKGSQTIHSVSTGATAKAGYGNLINIGVNDNSGGDAVYFGAVGQSAGNSAANFVFGRRTGAQTWAESARIDSSGNLGIGTTSPSTRLSLGSDIGQKLSVYDWSAIRSGFGTDMSGSSYELSIFSGYSGGNGIITFGGLNTSTNTYTERARIDSSGRLLVGTSSPAGSETLRIYNSTNSRITVDQASNGLILGADAGGAFLDTSGSNRLAFFLAGTERARIDSAGNLGLGVTPSGAKLHVYDTTARFVKLGNASSTWTFGPTGSSFAWRENSAGADQMTLDASGNLLVGTTSSGYVNANSVSLENVGYTVINHLNGTGGGSAYAAFGYNGSGIGSITQNGTTAVAFNTTSDHRLKTNVRPADAARFMDIEFVDFEWTDGRHDCGVIAHQLASVYPDLVIGQKDATEVRTVEITPAVPEVKDEEGNVISEAVPAVTEEQTFPKYQQVNYIGLIGRMGTRVQQLQRTVDAQAAMLAAMEARLAALEAA